MLLRHCPNKVGLLLEFNKTKIQKANYQTVGLMIWPVHIQPNHSNKALPQCVHEKLIYGARLHLEPLIDSTVELVQNSFKY